MFWTNLHNIQARSTRTLIEGPDGAVLGVVMTGAVTTFSSRFLVATIPVAGFLVTPGSYSLALLVTPNAGDGVEREVARRTFTVAASAGPAPEPAAGRVPSIRPAVSLGPDAGDQPLTPGGD